MIRQFPQDYGWTTQVKNSRNSTAEFVGWARGPAYLFGALSEIWRAKGDVCVCSFSPDALVATFLLEVTIWYAMVGLVR